MADGSWSAQGLATDGSLVQFTPGSAIAFAATNYGDNVALSAYQASTHARGPEEDHLCVATHLNNTQYVSSTQVSINGGAAQTISTSIPASTQVPLIVTYTQDHSVTISNVFVQAYDLLSPAVGPLIGMNIYALEQGVWTSWKNINGVTAQLSAGSGASSYSWRLGLSASPTSGNPKLFGLRFTLTWV